MQFRLVHTLTVLVVSLSACGKVAPTPFSRDPSIPVGLPPNPSAELGQNPPDTIDPTQPPVLPSSQYCAPVHNQYNEEVLLEKGRSSGSQSHSWGRGGGCVMRPIDEVWSTIFNHELVKWNGVSEIEVTPMPQVGSSSYHYEIKYIVHDFITVNWTKEWFHTVTEGDAQNPKTVVISFQRVRGTRFVPYWEGSIVLTRLTAGVTGFAMSNQIRADRTGPDEAAGGIADMIQALRTGHGRFPASELF
jgi:hypothetical protein